MTEPKECPCCGWPAEIRPTEVADRFLVRCMNYDACRLESGEFDLPAQAVEAWNRRHQPIVAVEASKIDYMVDRFAESLCNSAQPQITDHSFYKRGASKHVKEKWRKRVIQAFDFCGLKLTADLPTRESE